MPDRPAEPVTIDVEGCKLSADIRASLNGGFVIFAHGSGSSRLSTRNNFVARTLAERGLGTLLFDLLTEEEDQDPQSRFDIALLARRLEHVTRWVRRTQGPAVTVGLFGASTGSAAALRTAAKMRLEIKAVVSRGGRPDLAMDALQSVIAPTLLIVGANDHAVIELNREAYLELACERELAIVPGASHLFEEPGTLERVADLAADWFEQHLRTESIEIVHV